MQQYVLNQVGDHFSLSMMYWLSKV